MIVLKKKELLNLTNKIAKNEDVEVSQIDECGDELTFFVFMQNFKHVSIFFIFLFLALILFDKANKLSFIDLKFYIILVSICIGFCFLSAVVFYTLYIYNKKHNVVYTQKMVKNTHQYYQTYDFLSFIGLVVAIMLWLVMFIATPIEVVGNSMETNYYEKDKMLVWHLFYEPKQFDVVIVDVDEKYSFNEDTEFVIKRIVALGGDEVTYNPYKKIVYVNNEAVCVDVTIEEFETMMTFRYNNAKCYDGMKGTVPNGYMIILGDNRGVSMDSRSVGLVSEKDILGICFFRIYPFNRIGFAE